MSGNISIAILSLLAREKEAEEKGTSPHPFSLFSGLINHVNHDRRGATCREIVPEIGRNWEKRMKWRKVV
jgi:hypothetical protein